MFYADPFFLPSTVDFVHPKAACSSLVVLAVSRLGKRPTALHNRQANNTQPRGNIGPPRENINNLDKILLPMRNIANLQLKPRITRALRGNTCFAQEPISTRSATKRLVETLEAKYEKADLLAIIRENCSYLKASDREKLLSVLLKFELLFDGTLGDWKLPPVSFELKEGIKLYHGRPYPIPHKHKVILMKEIKQLCNIGVLVWQPSSRWASPTFIIPKKDSTVHTISDFRELNTCKVRKPYPIPK